MRMRIICLIAASLALTLGVSQLTRRGAEARPPVQFRRGRNLLRIARVGPISVRPETTVLDAIQTMKVEGVGALLITDADGRLEGIVTERDIMLRVVLRRRDPRTTPIGQVMTRSVTVIDNDRSPDDALTVMSRKRIRHLPVVGSSGSIEGMLSVRHVLGRKVERLESNLDTLAAYIAADGIGG